MRARWTQVGLLGGLLIAIAFVAKYHDQIASGVSSVWRAGIDSRQQAEQIKQSTVSIVYQLPHKRWLEFDLPSHAEQLMLLTNAEILTEARQALGEVLPPDHEWTYAIQYQLVNRRGKVIEEKLHHFRSRLTEYRVENSSEAVRALFYLQVQKVPVDSRLIKLTLTGARGKATAIRVKLARVDAPLSSVVIRAYTPALVSRHQLAYLWKRLPKYRREKLSEGNIYSEEMLSGNERAQLLMTKRAPLAPRGVAGQHYQQRHLYVRREIPGEEIREEIAPAGLMITPDQLATIPIPDNGGALRLHFQALSTEKSGNNRSEILMRWQGSKLTDRKSFHMRWNGKHGVFRETIPGGLLEIEVPEPVMVRAYLSESEIVSDRKESEAEEITPDPILTRGYRLDGKQELQIPITCTDRERTLIRVDLRRFDPAPISSTKASAPEAFPISKVAYRFLDQDGRALRGGELTTMSNVSRHDRMDLNREMYSLSEPTSVYFAVTSKVRWLSFPTTKEPVLVTVYNRSEGMAKLTQLPEDYDLFHQRQTGQQTWFLIRPHDEQVREKHGWVALLKRQSQLKEDDPDLLAGRYKWEDFLPENSNWRGNYILEPRDPGAKFREEALAVTFRELKLNRETDIRFRAEAGRDQIRPTLVFLSEVEQPLTLKVHIDGKLHKEWKTSSSQGELSPPPVSLSSRNAPHRVKVSASRSVRVFLNYAAPEDAPTLLKRLAVQVSKQKLSFQYKKISSEEELLSIVHYAPVGQKQSSFQVKLKLPQPRSKGPHLHWTFLNRRYQITHQNQQRHAVLGSDQRVQSGSVCFFPLGSDLKPGTYQIQIQAEKGTTGYLILHRSIPGEHERRLFFTEQPFSSHGVDP